MAKSNIREIRILPPMGGYNKKTAFRQPPPYTTASCVNVRNRDVFAGRKRVGRRPGLVSAMSLLVPDGDPSGSIYNLTNLSYVSNNLYTEAHHNFATAVSLAAEGFDTSYGDAPALAAGKVELQRINGEKIGGIFHSTFSNISGTMPMRISMAVETDFGFFSTTNNEIDFDIHFLCATKEVPDITHDGFTVRLLFDDDSNAVTGNLYRYKTGALTTWAFIPTVSATKSGTLTVYFDGTYVSVYFNNTCILSPTDVTTVTWTGNNIGFGIALLGMDVTLSQWGKVSTFDVDYFATTEYPLRRDMLVGVMNGKVYAEKTTGKMTEVTSAVSLNTLFQIQSAVLGERVYFADYGDRKVTGADGTIDATGLLLDAASVTDWTDHDINKYNHCVVITNGTGKVVNGTYYIQTIAAGNLTLTSTAGGTGTCAYSIERCPKYLDVSTFTMG